MTKVGYNTIYLVNKNEINSISRSKNKKYVSLREFVIFRCCFANRPPT